jgi:hypothetical protein
VAEAAGAALRESTGGLVEQRSGYFVRHVANLAAASHKQLEPEPELVREAFIMAQWAKQSAAAAALQQMGLRFAGGTDALAVLVRERQDLSTFRQTREKLLVEALGKSQGSRIPAFARLRKALDTGRARHWHRPAGTGVPAYAELASPKPSRWRMQRHCTRTSPVFPPGRELRLCSDARALRVARSTAAMFAEKVTAFRVGLIREAAKICRKAALFDLASRMGFTLLIGPSKRRC